MSFALALAFLAAPQAAPPASTDTLQVAMTRGGVRLEFAAKPAPGSREIKTAFGVFYTPLDPVAIVLESPRRARWRSELETNPKLSLMPTIAALDADGRIAELIEMIPVLEARLLEDELSSKAEHRRDELIAASNAVAALAQEFRFDRHTLTGPLALTLEVSGNLQLSRETFAAREVEEAMRRTTKALGEIQDWSLAITVHGGKVSLSRGSPYSGQELLIQAQSGAERSGLPIDRYTITRGADAEPLLWDDGRVRSANEHISIVVTGLGAAATR